MAATRKKRKPPSRRRSTMRPEDLRQWKKRHHHSFTSGAHYLGISRRSFQDYVSGIVAVPLTVARLCWALDRINLLEKALTALADHIGDVPDGMPFPDLEEPDDYEDEDEITKNTG